MVILLVFAVAVGLTLAVGSVGALFVGLAGAIGAERIARCEDCGHWRTTTSQGPLHECHHCRHRQLLHSLHGHGLSLQGLSLRHHG